MFPSSSVTNGLVFLHSGYLSHARKKPLRPHFFCMLPPHNSQTRPVSAVRSRGLFIVVAAAANRVRKPS